MSPSHTAGQDWTWTPTQNPAEPIFTVFVETKKIQPTIYNADGTIKIQGNKPHREISAFGSTPYSAPTKFKETAAEFSLPNLNSFGVEDWLFIGESAAGERTAFHFFQSKNQFQINTPWKIDPPKTVNHFWHAIVHRIWDEPDFDSPITIRTIDNDGEKLISGPSHEIMADITESVTEGSKLVRRYFLSATKPSLRHRPVPQGDTFKVVIKGPDHQSRPFDNVLHPLLVMEPAFGVTAASAGGTIQLGVGGGTDEQIFYPTNFTSRKPYILFEEAVQNQYGLWERIQDEIHPPKKQTRRIT